MLTDSPPPPTPAPRPPAQQAQRESSVRAAVLRLATACARREREISAARLAAAAPRLGTLGVRRRGIEVEEVWEEGSGVKQLSDRLRLLGELRENIEAARKVGGAGEMGGCVWLRGCSAACGAGAQARALEIPPSVARPAIHAPSPPTLRCARARPAVQAAKRRLPPPGAPLPTERIFGGGGSGSSSGSLLHPEDWVVQVRVGGGVGLW
jgi:hypothetical protein